MSVHLLTAKGSVKAANDVRQLSQLARLYGVATSYLDVQGRRRRPPPEALLAITRSLGAYPQSMADVERALEERRDFLDRQVVEPVIVVWEGAPAEIEIRLPSRHATTVRFNLETEAGERHAWSSKVRDLRPVRSASTRRDGTVFRRVLLPCSLQIGYHNLKLEIGHGESDVLIISAPMRAFTGSTRGADEKGWGVFLPLYALQSERSWGSGDFTDLKQLLDWTRELGGELVASLPLLAAFLDEPFEPSPYAPASRLFWNEFYLDVTRVPEFQRSRSAQAKVQSSAFQQELANLRTATSADYRHGMALKRGILEHLARDFFCRIGKTSALDHRKPAPPGIRAEQFLAYVKQHPAVEDYARFRAVCERRRTPWPSWPARQREGHLREGDYDERSREYHLYVQWQAAEQLGSICQQARSQGSGLCLDLPLGFHAAGYDVWRWPDTFVRGISAGAPPDTFFTKGQVWCFPPLHPESLKRQGYRYFIQCLRHQLQQASMLRVDHVMGFHRLFWIPDGFEAKDGTYVQYRAEDFYAICSVESHRHKARIVGENLGTVPPDVNPTMQQHGISGMYVVQYELSPRRKLRIVPRNCVASLNTHDTPLFDGFWQGLDIDDQLQLGLVDEAGAKTAQRVRDAQRRSLIRLLRAEGWLDSRAASPISVLRAALEWLSATPAQFVLVNLEDLWLEPRPQNVPGTGHERPNWRRKAAHELEEFSGIRELRQALKKVNELRSGEWGDRKRSGRRVFSKS